MADLADVELALLETLSGALAPASAFRLYRGWPIAAALQADLAAGVTNISVFTIPDSTRNTTRWGVQVNRSTPVPGLTFVQMGLSVTFAGSPAAGDLAGLLIGNRTYVHQVAPADTPTGVAAALADLARADYPCLQAAATLTFPTAPNLLARVTASATVLSEWRRQEQGFRISIWANSPMVRDQIAGITEGALAPIAFLTLADNTAGRLRHRGTAVIDDDRDASVYRRDLLVDVEYPTTTQTTLATMLFGELGWNGAPYFG